MKNLLKLSAVLAAACVLAGPAFADVVFEEVTSQSGMPMGGGSGTKTKVLISGDRYRAQKKLTIDQAGMADQMKFQQQMGGVNMGMMNKINRAGQPEYPDHIMTLDEWAEFEPNKQMIDDAAKSGKGGGVGGLLGKKTGLGGLLGKKADKPQVTADDVLRKYCSELDAGIIAKKQDQGADAMAAGGGLGGMLSIASAVDYDTWARSKIIRGVCPGSKEQQEQLNAAAASGFGGGGAKTASFAEMRKISDDSSKEYAALKRDFDKDSANKAEYAKQKEKNKEMAGTMDKKMGDSMSSAMGAADDMMLNVQIVRLDTGKTFEIFPPKAGKKDPKPEDVTYTEGNLSDLKDQVQEREEKKQQMMKANEGKMKDAEAKRAAAMAKYGAAAGGGAPEAKQLGTETVNGIPCEHWQVTGMSSVDDYWVSKKFQGADEILAFEAKLKAKIGAGRDGLSFGGPGGMDMSAMMSGVNPAMDAEVAKIKARGVVIKHVNTMKNAAPTQGAMLQNQKAVSGDIGAAAGDQKMSAMAMMQNMTPAQKAAMMKDPAMMQKMMGGDKIGAAAQASAEKNQASGGFSQEKQDMSSTYELKLVGNGPVPAAAFEAPQGAKKK